NGACRRSSSELLPESRRRGRRRWWQRRPSGAASSGHGERVDSRRRWSPGGDSGRTFGWYVGGSGGGEGTGDAERHRRSVRQLGPVRDGACSDRGWTAASTASAGGCPSVHRPIPDRAGSGSCLQQHPSSSRHPWPAAAAPGASSAPICRRYWRRRSEQSRWRFHGDWFAAESALSPSPLPRRDRWPRLWRLRRPRRLWRWPRQGRLRRAWRWRRRLRRPLQPARPSRLRPPRRPGRFRRLQRLQQLRRSRRPRRPRRPRRHSPAALHTSTPCAAPGASPGRVGRHDRDGAAAAFVRPANALHGEGRRGPIAAGISAGRPAVGAADSPGGYGSAAQGHAAVTGRRATGGGRRRGRCAGCGDGGGGGWRADSSWHGRRFAAAGSEHFPGGPCNAPPDPAAADPGAARHAAGGAAPAAHAARQRRAAAARP
ncbi:unnamed protein product, partial [Phaeothamnion confervicola]